MNQHRKLCSTAQRWVDSSGTCSYTKGQSTSRPNLMTQVYMLDTNITFHIIQVHTEHVAQTVTFLTYLRDNIGSNFGRDTRDATGFFVGPIKQIPAQNGLF